jgi:hypothetical protein
LRHGTGINSPSKFEGRSDLLSSDENSVMIHFQKYSSNCVSNIDIYKESFPKISDSKFNSNHVERKTIIFDFDETLAKVTFHKDALPGFDEQIDMLTKFKNL